MCDAWHDFSTFKDWALTNGYEETLTLDREDNDTGYNPNNCRWATKLEQIINKSNTKHLTFTAFGETKHLLEWTRDPRCKVSHLALRYRIRAGWNPEEALTKPAERKSKQNVDNWLKQNHPELYASYQQS